VSIELATSIIMGLGAYFGVGALIGLLFLTFGVGRLDLAAKGASIMFRPMIFLGCIAVWPLLILRILSFKQINHPAGEEE